jgi:hypothetical protein
MPDPRTASIDLLKSQGWKTFPSDKDYAISFYKKFDIEPSCYTNKNGIQLCVELYYLEGFEPPCSSWSINLKAESESEDWVNFNFYSLSIDDLESKLESLTQKLILAWQSVNTLETKK